MKKVALFFLNFILVISCLSFTAAAGTRTYSPNTSSSISAASTYCQNATATAISFVYNTCYSGNGAKAGSAITIKWYSNTTNSTSGGTLMSTTSGTSATTITGTVSYTPSTTTVGTRYYYCVIMWTGAGTCNTSGTLTSATCKVVVNGTPSTITGTATACTSATTTLANTTANGTWSSANTAIATVGSTSGVVTGVALGTTTITYTTGCGTAATKTVTVNSAPVLAAITGTFNVCSGSNTTLSNSTSGGTWSSSNTSFATVGSANGIVHGVATGMPTISYSVTNSCGTTVATTTVAVSTTPASITGASAVCSGSTTTLSNSVPYGTWSSSNTATATVGSTTGVVTGAGNGTVTITYSTGCGSAATKAMTVNNAPITGNTNVCAGSTTTLSDAINGGTWSSSNTSIATVGSTTGVVTVVTGVSVGNATISYTSGGCASTALVTVLGTPATINGTASVCAGFTSTLTNTTTNGTWSSSNTSIATVGSATGIVTGVAAGTCTITYSTGCGTDATKTFTVNTQPAAIGGTTTVCATATTTLTDATGGGVWSSGSTGVATVGSTGIVAGVASGSAAITYAIGSCTSTANVTVNPMPNAGSITGTTSVCEAGTTTLSDATGGGAWSTSDGMIASVDASGVVSGVVAGNANISYSVTNSCGTANAVASVTVIAIPSVDGFTATANVCAGSQTTLSITPAGGAWSSSNTGVATVGSTGVVTGLTAGTTLISYTLSNACGSDFDTTTVFVSALPASITGTASVCVGSTTTLNDATPGGAWSSSNTSVATVGSSTGVVNGIAAGSATVTYTTASGCTSTTAITVNAMPASITGTASVCVGSTTTLNDATPGGTWSSSNTSVATVGSSTGVVNGIAAGSATVTYTTASGCTSTTAITVNALPASITGTASVCVGSTTTLNDATSGGAWSSNNTSVASVGAANGIVSGVAAGSATITYTSASGCITTTAITVNALPASITGTTSICNGSSATLNDATASGTWSSNNTSVATIDPTTGYLTGVAVGSATVSYMSPAGCVTTTGVTVNALPAAINGTTSICNGSIVTLTDATTGGTWSSSNTSVATVGSTTGKVNGISAGSATVTYALVATGCAVTANVTINAAPGTISGATTVCPGTSSTLNNALPGGTWSSSNTSVASIDASGLLTGVAAGSATITYTSAAGCVTTTAVTISSSVASIGGASSVCAGLTTTLTDATSGGTWSTSDATIASVDASGIVSGVAAGAATVTYTAASGCSATKAITVNGLPASVTGAGAICSGKSIALADATTGGTWSSGNTSVATVGSTGIVVGVASGSATISYTDGNGCSSTTVVTVNASPAAIGFTTYNVCTGSTITLTNATPGGTWSSSSTTKATVDANTGVVSGILAAAPTITYKLTSSGCFATKQITVSTTPQAIVGTKSVCVGATTTLTDASTGATWSSSNSSVASVGAGAGVVTGVAAGTATISYLVASTGCAAVTTVTVNPNPAAISGAPSMICTGSSVTLSDATPGGTWTNTNTRVSVGSTTGVVTGMTTGGTVDVIYQLPTGCKATTTMTVNLAASPITGASSVCEGSTIALYNADAGGTWTTSNSALATVSAGTVNAVAAGSPVVTYTIPTGCYAIKTITVNAAPSAIGGSTSLCAGTTVTLTNNVSGGTWTSGNTAVATINPTSGVVTAIVPVTAPITYTLANGCAAMTTMTVNAMPYAITGIKSVCPNGTTTLADAYTAASGSWSSSNSSVAAIDASGVVSGVVAGTATISYSLASGCAAVATVTVNPMPASISGSSSVCIGSTITMSNTTSGGYWQNSNTRISIDSVTGVVTGLTEGPSIVRYVLSATGCMTTMAINVNALPSVIYGVTTVGAGATEVLASGSTGGNWNSSDNDVAVCSTSGHVTGIAAGHAIVTYTLPTTGCYVTTDVTVVTSGGRHGLTSNATAAETQVETTVYPNPATTATINVKSGAAGVVYLFSIDGKEVANYNISEGVNAVNLPSEVVPGIYMCIFKGNNGSSSTTRLIYKP